jgi:hypothetical protein
VASGVHPEFALTVFEGDEQMFKSFVCTVGLTCLVGVLGLATEAHGAATVSLKAVRKNGTPIPGGPVSSLPVARGDIITAEVLISGWSTPAFDPPSNTGLVQTYQATLLRRAGTTSNGGDITVNAELTVPLGWDAPIDRRSCTFGCVAPYTTCDPVFGCVGPNFQPERMVRVCVGGTRAGLDCNTNADCTGGGTCPQIANLRTDYIFYLNDTIRSVDTATLDIRWGGSINGADGQTTSRCQGGAAAGEPCSSNANCSGGTCNANFISYGGSLNLKVGAEACGTFTFNFDPGTPQGLVTFLCNTGAPPICTIPTLEGLTLTVTCFTCASGACCDTTDPQAPTCEVTGAGFCIGTNKRYGGDGSTCANINPPCAVADPTGACCIESTGVCTNGVTDASCSGRWGGANSTCATLDPPCANSVIACNPANCLIDARIPNLQGALAQRRGYTSMTMTFANAPGPGEDASADFQVTQVPPPLPNPPTINNPLVIAGNDVTLNFSGPIQATIDVHSPHRE